jgi:hypothetical protein
LIWAVRNPIEETTPIKVKGRFSGEYETVITDHGVSDKRLLVVEGEFASTLKVMKREGNTLSAVIRNAWDSGELGTMTKNSPAKATGAHVSIIGHITKDELLRSLDTTDAGNGFGNRFLWVCVRRARILPEGGSIDSASLSVHTERLTEAYQFAQRVGELRRYGEAREIWHSVYPSLSEGKPGLLGAMIARAEAQVMRLASIYAVMDCSEVIRKEHLYAALALWDYCEASARYIFGDFLGDPTADDILRSLKGQSNGLTRTDIRNLFQRNKNKVEIDRALKTLLEGGFARVAVEETKGNFRGTERWRAV